MGTSSCSVESFVLFMLFLLSGTQDFPGSKEDQVRKNEKKMKEVLSSAWE